ncbi:MAG: type II toxin-antitoxin system VapC family toxin [Planctomycetota bacterium]|jgi:predicted nucleic acid-binding protein
MKCFVDTSGLLAMLNRDDDCHGRAAVAWKQLIEEERRLVTTSYVLVEAFALCQSRLGLVAVNALHSDVEPILEVVWVDAAIHRRSTAAVLAAGRRKLSLVDCASFEVMRDEGIAQAFTFDRHFKDQGFRLFP